MVWLLVNSTLYLMPMTVGSWQQPAWGPYGPQAGGDGGRGGATGVNESTSPFAVVEGERDIDPPSGLEAKLPMTTTGPFRFHGKNNGQQWECSRGAFPKTRRQRGVREEGISLVTRVLRNTEHTADRM